MTIATHSYLLLTLALVLTAVLVQRPFRVPRPRGSAPAPTFLDGRARLSALRHRRVGAPAGEAGVVPAGAGQAPPVPPATSRLPYDWALSAGDGPKEQATPPG